MQVGNSWIVPLRIEALVHLDNLRYQRRQRTVYFGYSESYHEGKDATKKIELISLQIAKGDLMLQCKRTLLVDNSIQASVSVCINNEELNLG